MKKMKMDTLYELLETGNFNEHRNQYAGRYYDSSSILKR